MQCTVAACSLSLTLVLCALLPPGDYILPLTRRRWEAGRERFGAQQERFGAQAEWREQLGSRRRALNSGTCSQCCPQGSQGQQIFFVASFSMTD